jgi:hypothetical protein
MGHRGTAQEEIGEVDGGRGKGAGEGDCLLTLSIIADGACGIPITGPSGEKSQLGFVK